MGRAEDSPLVIAACASLEHGLEHFARRESEEDRRFAILHLGQTMALLSKAHLQAQGVSFDVKTAVDMGHIMRLYKEAGRELPMENEVKLVINRRNVCEHQGAVPDETQLQFCVDKTVEFVLRVMPDLGLSKFDVIARVPRLLPYVMPKVSDGRPEKPAHLDLLERAAAGLYVWGTPPGDVSKMLRGALADFVQQAYLFLHPADGAAMLRTLQASLTGSTESPGHDPSAETALFLIANGRADFLDGRHREFALHLLTRGPETLADEPTLRKTLESLVELVVHSPVGSSMIETWRKGHAGDTEA